MGIFNKLFGKYLLFTNTASCGLMMAIADVIHQQGEKLRQNNSIKLIKSTDTNEIQMKTENKIQTKLKTEFYDKNKISHKTTNQNECREKNNHENQYQREILMIPCKTDYDFNRTKNMLTVGLLQGPFHHYFYRFLDKNFPGKKIFSIFKKTMLDQMISSPSCLAIFFCGHGLLERKSLTEINMEMRQKFFHTWKVDWCFFPPAQIVNFLFVPLQYRVIYINAITVIFDIFLSYMKYEADFSLPT
ncbi:mpv17-like protein 2 [Leptopilina heterotoma]|uniref:mpv17-like protein 2 n=1 Tax=Leptopilina heterotoma TaxID=63436 RepID=UPI001CA8D5BF|nr:mpv17-like protein 2 [Leptopilina heterotoma]